MQVSNKVFIVLTLAFAFSLVLGSSLFAQEKMTMDQYNAQLQEWQQREAAAKKASADCGTAVENLKSEINAANAETQKTWEEILAMIGTDQAGVDAFRAKLKALESDVDGLLALSPEELFKKRDEIKAAEEKLAEYKKNRISALTEMQNLIATIEGKLTQLKNKLPKAVYDEYTVIVGDYLWKISGKADIYDDPMQWMRIYSYNKEQISNPDLIFPEQIFKIHRQSGDNEYLVAKGDYLQKIAGNADVLGDPSKWTKIYEKNKDIIGEDANLIFPYTVLVIPED
jgi:nucleoid-associated protein YgaU